MQAVSQALTVEEASWRALCQLGANVFLVIAAQGAEEGRLESRGQRLWRHCLWLTLTLPLISWRPLGLAS